MSDGKQPWHHRPAHVFESNTMYIVTAGTLYKKHIFHESQRLRLLQDALFEVAQVYDWTLQAWAVFSNHYHFIARSPDDGKTLRPMIQRLHSQTSREVNRLDGAQGRKVWFQYWDTCLTYEKSYYARLNYVHNNPEARFGPYGGAISVLLGEVVHSACGTLVSAKGGVVSI